MWGMIAASSFMAQAQAKMDEQRMEQDIEVAENILGTLVRQQFGRRNFLPIEVSGHYLPGYGVTFRLPHGGAFNFLLMNSSDAPNIMENIGPGSYSYSYSFSTPQPVLAGEDKEYQARTKERQALAEEDKARMKERQALAEEDKARMKERQAKGQSIQRTKSGTRVRINSDSVNSSIDQKFLEVAKNFLADYGDVLSQLRPEERIVITNRAEDFEGGFEFKWAGGMGSQRGMMSAEVKRDDINQMKQGKITRDQFLSRIKIVNTESSGELEPDLEVLSSMFGRLYREDLSRTYYVQGEVSYERLKDFGVIYYMRVYSSNEEDDRFYLPTVGLRDVSQVERDKKVKELYPKFESELKENLVEYGRTLRSLKDEEQVLFKVKLTRCDGCGIPETLELSVKNSVLKDYGSGKMSKEAVLAKVSVKKVGEQ